MDRTKYDLQIKSGSQDFVVVQKKDKSLDCEDCKYIYLDHNGKFYWFCEGKNSYQVGDTIF